MEKAFQDLIGAENHCYGCGPENEKGNRIKSYWDGDESVCKWKARPEHCAGAPDVVYGGLIASLIDCHSVNTAMANAYKEAGREVGSEPKLWCVTANLNVNYRRPTPIDAELELRAKVKKRDGKKTWITCDLIANGEVCADAEVLAIQINRNS